MSTLTHPDIFVRLRPILRTALCAGVITLGGIVSGNPVVAQAEPGEWDIGQYDSCIARISPVISGASQEVERTRCCYFSGGTVVENGQAASGCAAPPANAQGPQRAPTGKRPPPNGPPIGAKPPAAQ